MFDWLIPFYNFRVVAEYFGAFVDGFLLTLWVSGISLTIALSLGLVIAVLRTRNIKVIGSSLAGFVECVRSTPLLIQLYLLYFSLGAVPGFRSLTALEAGISALGLNQAAYFSETIRAGILSISKGQLEASRALGMNSKQSLFLVVLPQVWRKILPTLVGQSALLIEDSAIVSFIGVVDLTGVGLRLMSERLMPNEGFLTVAGGYLLVYGLASMILRFVGGRTTYRSTGKRAW